MGPVIVRDHIPLEQGLRRDVVARAWQRVLGQRPYSIRTRIKTFLRYGRWRVIAASETIFH